VRWLPRLGRRAPRDVRAEEPEEEARPPLVERPAPGIAALFADLREDGSHRVLDLGAATGSSFRIYSRFARRIRFADLLEAPLRGERWTEALRLLPEAVGEPFDLVLAWNLLDRVPPELRLPVVERLTRITGPGARLYILADTSRKPIYQPFRFTLLGTDRVGQQAMGDPGPAGPGLLPADVTRIIAPFDVVHAFTLRDGYREYVSVRR